MASTSSTGIDAYLKGFRQLPLGRRIGLVAAVLGVLALTVAVLLWAQRPTYKMLYNNLEMRDAGEVVQAIEQMKIPYRLDEKSGAILVPAGKVHEVRLQLAAQGLPRGGSVGGFELLDKQQGFGISRFMESRRYQQALEGELARSIATLENVRSARVHLAMPKQSVFIRKREKPSASVVVNLRPGQVPTERQVQAIVHLVASAIPGLTADRVTVVDQSGRLLTNREKSTDLDLTNQQFPRSWISPVASGRRRATIRTVPPFAASSGSRSSYMKAARPGFPVRFPTNHRAPGWPLSWSIRPATARKGYLCAASATPPSTTKWTRPSATYAIRWGWCAASRSRWWWTTS